MISLGIDVSLRRGLDLVVLDDEQCVIGCERRIAPRDLAEHIDRIGPDVIAIDSPPGSGSSGATRPCERALRELGVNIFSTPSDPTRFGGPFYDWIREGMAAFAAAEAVGYTQLGNAMPSKAVLEVFPHASDVFLRGCLPPAGVTSRVGRKRAWRTDTLRRAGVSGLEQLKSMDAVDAALAAVTGHFALRDTIVKFGDPGEILVVPGELPSKPFERCTQSS